MKAVFRRVITGINTGGKSCVTDDSCIRPDAPSGSIEVWREESHARTVAQGASARQQFYPLPNESFFRLVQLPPLAQATLPELAAGADAFFTANRIPECRIDTTRHPFMHRTPSIDYVMVLSGSVSLQLDAGEPISLRPMDTVVQRATNHAWINTGDESAWLLVVLLGVGPVADPRAMK